MSIRSRLENFLNPPFKPERRRLFKATTIAAISALPIDLLSSPESGDSTIRKKMKSFYETRFASLGLPVPNIDTSLNPDSNLTFMEIASNPAYDNIPSPFNALTNASREIGLPSQKLRLNFWREII